MIRWLHAFIDRPASELDVAVEFWSTVTGTTARPGPEPAFAGLHSELGDDWLEVHGIPDGPGGAHLGFSVDDVRVFADRAVAAGASVVADLEHWQILASPAGSAFRVAPWRGQKRRPRPFAGPDGGLSRVHQVCLDLPPSRFDAEVAFWRAVTGWPLDTTGLPVFSRLQPQRPVPIRILLQRLDEERDASAHLDVSASGIPATRAWHESLGASFVGEWPHWTTMTDPAGGTYCLTRGDPAID